MRLGGLLGILKKHYSDPNVAACATNGVIANNLDKRDFEHVAMVIAFRDAYMHGEIPDDPQQRFAAFRQDFDDKYSLKAMFDACIAVWDQVFTHYQRIAPK